MAKVQDTYNPITGEYVKRIGDWISLEGSLPWSYAYHNATSNSLYLPKANIPGTINGITTVFKGFKYDSTECTISDTGGRVGAQIALPIEETGFSPNVAHLVNEYKAYFYGWRMANADGTSPYYKSEVAYDPITWAGWTKTSGNTGVLDSTGAEIIGDGTTWVGISKASTPVKKSTKYGVLYNVISSTIVSNLKFGGGTTYVLAGNYLTKNIGNNKFVGTTRTDLPDNPNLILDLSSMSEPIGNKIKFKDFRIFELPAGSQIEADFTNLTADELSAKYTFNGLCVKHWKKVTDGTGLTSTLPTASYAGYTPYKMIYQLATPEISYLTPKTAIPLYDTNTIVETDTPSDCKADVTVGYKLKNGVTAVAGDITAPTPDYPSNVTSTSENGSSKSIVKSPNIIVNGSFSNGVTGWGAVTSTSVYRTSPASGYKAAAGSGANQDVADGKPGDKIYVSAYLKVASGVTANIGIFDLGGFLNKRTIGTTTSTSFVKISGTTEIQNTNGFRFDIGSGGETWYDDVFVCNLTALYGAGNEPTKEQCDALFATWQDKDSSEATLPTLRKIGTVSDSFNPETGKIVRRIGKKVFNGTEDWATQVSSVGNNYITPLANTYFIEISDASTTDSNETLSNMFRYSPINNYNDSQTRDNLIGTVHRISSTEKRRFFRISNDEVGINYSTVYPINDGPTTLVKFKAWLAQRYAEGNPVCLYYVLEKPVLETSAIVNMTTYNPVSVLDCADLVKPVIKASYQLRQNAASMEGDFIASPECVNDIKDLGNSIDIVSSVGRENVLRNSSFRENTNLWSSASQNFVNVDGYDCIKFDGEFGKTKTVSQSLLGKLKVGETYTVSGWWKVENIVRGTTNYTIMFYADGYYNENGVNTWYGLGAKEVNTAINGWQYVTYQFIPTKEKYGKATSATFFGYTRDYTGSVYMRDFKIEKNSTASPFVPSTEDISYNTIVDNTYKTNIALNNPLRSLGTVKDRLFKDSDGKWKVERNIGEKVFDGTESWNKNDGAQTLNTLYYKWSSDFEGGWKQFGFARCSHLPFYDSSVSLINSPNQWLNDSVGFSSGGNASAKYFNFGTIIGIGTNNTNGVKAYLASEHSKGTPVTVQYQLVTPTYETLSQELQTKLDNIPTFPDGNYVYTVANDNLQPMLHVDYKKLSWLKSRLLLNSLKIYSRNLTDAEMEQNYRIEKERYGM